MMLSKVRGQELAEEFPEIADDFRRGYTLPQLARKYSNDDDTSESVAVSSTWEALQILISPKEYAQLRTARQKVFGKIRGRLGGNTTYQRKVGAFALSQKARKAASHKGGKRGGTIAGNKVYLERIGMFAPDFDREAAAKRRTISRGETPYEWKKRRTKFGWLTERDFIIVLKFADELTWKEIADTVNAKFGNDRNWSALQSAYGTWARQDQQKEKGKKRKKSPARNAERKAGEGTRRFKTFDVFDSAKHKVLKRRQVPLDHEKRRTKYGMISEKAYVIALREKDGLLWRQIADRVNAVFHNNRHLNTLQGRYMLWKRA